MREREELRPSHPRRSQDEEADSVDESAPRISQSIESLKEGYSWIRHLQAQHPGWEPAAVEGFPFTLPIKELGDCSVALIALAGVYVEGQKPFNVSPGVVPPACRAMRFRDRGDWSFREIPIETDPEDLRIAHAHYDHSDADEDINCVFPITPLRDLEQEGFIGAAAKIHYGLMGYVPEVDPIVATVRDELIPHLNDQEVDVVVLAGGCALSHQSAALIQREIEGGGIPTVGVSVCQDITYQLQVPRAAALRFPLGNPFGSSMDASMQIRVLRDALNLVHSTETPGQVVALPYEWIHA